MTHHPVYPLLCSLGKVVLVGSRDPDYRPITCPKPTEETDWDYYLGIGAPGVIYADACQLAVKALIAAGGGALPAEGGPYGRDGLVYAIVRFPEATQYGVKWAHADVIVMPMPEMERRIPIWNRLRQTTLPRAIKAECAWGPFWWVVYK